MRTSVARLECDHRPVGYSATPVIVGKIRVVS
jgi:hypothetical protein